MGKKRENPKSAPRPDERLAALFGEGLGKDKEDIGKGINMKIITEQISLSELKQMSERVFGNLVKAVVDIEKEIMAVDADLHADQEALLIEKGSTQENLWGISIYPDLPKDQMIEFDSMINLRPSFGNRSRGVDNPEIQKKIIKIVNKLIKE